MRPPLPDGHPLHDEEFCRYVYEKALATPPRLMVEDRGFLDNMARGMSGRDFRDRRSTFTDDEPGGIMLLWREYIQRCRNVHGRREYPRSE